MARSTVGVGLVGVAWASGDHDKPQRIDAPAGDWSISLTDACRRRGADRGWANTDLSAAGCFRRDPSVRDVALDPGGTTPLACRGRMCCLRRLRPPRLRDVPHFVAHSHTLHNCCVRFVAPSPEAHATLTTSWALPLTPAFLKYIRLRQPEPQQQRSARRNSVLASSLVTPWAFSPRT